MNLWFRLIWAIIRAFRQRTIRPGETIERTLRVWPNDLDVNGHMNNGRYLTVVDLILVEYFVRSGFARILMKSGWRPMSGGVIITYRKGLKPWQRYRLRFALEAADTIWNYMRFEFVRADGVICAAGYMKGAAVGREGLVPNSASYAAMGQTFQPQPLPEALQHWVDAERAIMRAALPS